MDWTFHLNNLWKSRKSPGKRNKTQKGAVKVIVLSLFPFMYFMKYFNILYSQFYELNETKLTLFEGWFRLKIGRWVSDTLECSTFMWEVFLKSINSSKHESGYFSHVCFWKSFSLLFGLLEWSYNYKTTEGNNKIHKACLLTEGASHKCPFYFWVNHSL